MENEQQKETNWFEVAKLFPEIDVTPFGTAQVGGHWFVDKERKRYYRIELSKDGEWRVAETRGTQKTKIDKSSVAKIVCCDCGTERTVANQDKFQVKRCVLCQKKHRNRKRSLRAKVVRQEKATTKKLTELNGN